MGVTFPGESSEHRAAREDLLQKEIELRRLTEAVAVARRALPPGPLVAQDYVFDALDADDRPVKVKLSELFAPGKDSLIVYNYMFPRHPQDTRPKAQGGSTAGLPIEDGPCPSCTGLLDQLDGAIPHLEAAGANFAVIAKAPIERVTAFARDRGWRHMRFVSSGANSFKRDYHAEADDGSLMPMMSVFHRGPDGIRHFWSSEMMQAGSDPGQDPRQNGTIEPFWNMLDLTPEGRPDFNEQLDYPCCKAAG